jgi:hypothetical protein
VAVVAATAVVFVIVMLMVVLVMCGSGDRNGGGCGGGGVGDGVGGGGDDGSGGSRGDLVAFRVCWHAFNKYALCDSNAPRGRPVARAESSPFSATQNEKSSTVSVIVPRARSVSMKGGSSIAGLNSRG